MTSMKSVEKEDGKCSLGIVEESMKIWLVLDQMSHCRNSDSPSVEQNRKAQKCYLDSTGVLIQTSNSMKKKTSLIANNFIRSSPLAYPILWCLCIGLWVNPEFPSGVSSFAKIIGNHVQKAEPKLLYASSTCKSTSTTELQEQTQLGMSLEIWERDREREEGSTAWCKKEKKYRRQGMSLKVN